MNKYGILLSSLFLLSCYGDPSSVTGEADADDFAVAVVSYRPAPGQYVNNSSYGNSSAAPGIPDGSIVSLGGFGGSITLRFLTPIRDIPGKPDFVVWGNALYNGNNPRKRWAEPGLIEVSEDGNSWYLIGGSFFSPGFQPATNVLAVTYSNTNASYWPSWITGDEYRITNVCLNTAFEPRIDPSGSLAYTNSPTEAAETLYGYADCTPKGTVDRDWSADDPLSFGIEGSGGDPIKLEWAVDTNGNSIYTAISNRSFYYIRITTAVHRDNGIFGETSTEIDAVGVCR